MTKTLTTPQLRTTRLPRQNLRKESAKPTAITLFSGLGSSSKALRDLGFDVVAHEFMPEAVESLNENGFDVIAGDIRQVNFANAFYSDVEVLVGGPPCQPFSQAHDGDGQYDPRDMIPDFVRAVAHTLPRLFVMEEVQTLTWKKHAAYLERVEGDLRAIGYRVEHRVLNAADYGHAQARKRLFVVGIREDQTFGHQWLDAADYTPVTMAERLGWNSLVAFQRNQQVPDGRAHVKHLYDARLNWVFDRASTTVVGSFRPEVQAAPGYRKAGDGPRQATPGSVVTTLEERLLLQDLPIDWVVCGNEAKRALQVGNSVPTGLIRDLVDLNYA